MANLKVAAFNVEILFARPIVFNFRDHSIGDEVLEKVNDRRKLTTDSKEQVQIEEQFHTVTHWTNQASDNGAVWGEFDVL